MPNGEDKNWVRLCGALDGFYVRYGHWPTRLRLSRYAFEDFRHMFKPETLHRLLGRFEVHFDNELFAVESDGGRRYDYAHEGFPTSEPPVRARSWLGVSPDAGNVDPTVAGVSQGGIASPDQPRKYDLTVGGRQLCWLDPSDVVIEVVRYLVHDVGLSREEVDKAAGRPLLSPSRSGDTTAPSEHAGADTATMRRSRSVIRMATGERFDVQFHPQEYRSVLYGLESVVPFGMISWKETRLVSKETIAKRLELDDPRFVRRLQRGYEPPFDASGPIPNSYWASGEGLLAGEYPFEKGYEAGEAKLRQVITAGITCFIDLTHRTESLTGYSDAHLEGVARRPEYHWHAMEPGRVPERSAVEMVLDTIDDALLRRQVVYVHDRGGRGRSALVVGCHLVRRGLSGDEALAMLNRLASRMPKARGKTTPESANYQRFVRAWGD